MANLVKKEGWLAKLLNRKTKPLFKTGALPADANSTGWVPNSTSVLWDSVIEYQNETAAGTAAPKVRVEKKPIEIWQEIIAEIPKINLVDIEKQIKSVERRKKILKDEIGMNTPDEDKALGYLYARRKLKKLGKNEFLWQTTTGGLVTQLCSKYKVKSVPFQSYYKCVPNEALEEVKKFADAWKKVSEKEPVMQLIVDEGGKEDRKDPILLASSPFGNWWFILGAWDKEVEFVDELIYGRKEDTSVV